MNRGVYRTTPDITPVAPSQPSSAPLHASADQRRLRVAELNSCVSVRYWPDLSTEFGAPLDTVRLASPVLVCIFSAGLYFCAHWPLGSYGVGTCLGSHVHGPCTWPRAETQSQTAEGTRNTILAETVERVES